MKYFISWEIDIEADSAEAAALEALRIQRDPESIATVFHVIDEMGMDHEVDVADAALLPVAYSELSSTARDLGGVHPAKHYQVELLRAALTGLFDQCAMMHKHWGENSNQREADAAIESARRALEATK